MKVRTGFVSNSSSSSFVGIVTKEGYEIAIKRVSKLVKATFDQLAEERTIFGKECFVAKAFSTAGDGGTFEDFPFSEVFEAAGILEDIQDEEWDQLVDQIHDSAYLFLEEVPEEEKEEFSQHF